MTPPKKKLKPDTAKTVDQQPIARMTENNDDVQMAELKYQAEYKQNEEKIKILTAKLAETEERYKQFIQQKTELAEINKKLKELATKVEATSLASMFYDEKSPLNNKSSVLIGTNTSHAYPDHDVATGQVGTFDVHYLKQVLPQLSHELGFDFCFDQEPSVFKVKFRNEAPYFDAEGDVRICLDSVLHDAAEICNCIISKIAPDKIELATKAESSLFSNVIDHVVVYDKLSDTRVFATETKTTLDGKVSVATKVFGQAFDQLGAMKLKGNPCPFGALSCYNGTQITWLNSDAHNEIVTNHNSKKFELRRLQQIIDRLPTRENNSDVISSQSPLKMSAKAGDACTGNTPERRDERKCHTSSRDTSGTNKHSRTFCISKLFGQEKILDVFVNAIFCALSECFPRTVIEFKKGCIIEISDAIALLEDSYDWSSFNTTYQGPLTKTDWDKRFEKKLHLVSFIGRGDTSKVYRAISGDGYDCVIKIFVQRRDLDNEIMPKDKFLKVSKKLADTEFANYKAIYGKKSLMKYVWRETLNNLHCIIMPFFELIIKQIRDSEMVTVAIKSRLEQFVKCNKQFKPSDQSWRHIGYFQNELYLFDLGSLDDLVEQDAPYIEEHLKCLKARDGQLLQTQINL